MEKRKNTVPPGHETTGPGPIGKTNTPVEYHGNKPDGEKHSSDGKGSYTGH